MSNKDIFCAVPWHNSHLYWDGTYGACCSERTRPSGPEKNLADTSITEWYNSDAMRDFRLRILGDQKLPECEGCYKEESHGHESRRIKENFKVGIFTKQAFKKSFEQSPWAEKFNDSKQSGFTNKLPIDLHLDFGNECNLACKMCFPAASSRITQQYIKWQIPVEKKSNWTNSDLLYQKFLDNIKSLPNLHRIHVMGGEPLINKKFYDFVDWLVDNNYKDLSLSFVSNGTRIDFDFIEKLKFFKSVDIEISLESVYDNNHYIRQGSNTQQLLNNINQLVSKRTNTLNIVLRSVPQLLNVNNYYDYILFAYKNRLSIQSIPLTRPNYLAINVLPATIKKSLIKKYQTVIEKIATQTPTVLTLATGRDTSRLEQLLIGECQSIIEMLNQPEPDNVEQLRQDLVFWLMRWDKVFNLNAYDYYPEYKEFFQEYGYRI
jgi:sulfatase maturation enzyme AslB (radical SAM superfamily)